MFSGVGCLIIGQLTGTPAESHILEGQNAHPTLSESLLLLGGRDTPRGVSGRPASTLLSLFHSLLHKVEGLKIFHYKLNFFFPTPAFKKIKYTTFHSLLVFCCHCWSD